MGNGLQIFKGKLFLTQNPTLGGCQREGRGRGQGQAWRLTSEPAAPPGGDGGGGDSW